MSTHRIARWFQLTNAHPVLRDGHPCRARRLRPAAIQRQFVERFGTDRTAVLTHWLELTGKAQQLEEKDKLVRINNFIDSTHCSKATSTSGNKATTGPRRSKPSARDLGDCEDFAILKYVSLRLAGVPRSKLRLVYAKARLDTPRPGAASAYGDRLLRPARRRTARSRQPRRHDPAGIAAARP